ncbi:MAG: AmmeMemoRadiSam system radical SAM enzyme [Candidatus Poribacteria bacterium]
MPDKLSRREFIECAACGAMTLALGSSSLKSAKADALPDLTDGKHIFVTKEAMYYEKLHENEIRCKLCPKECVVGDKERGWCGVRENHKGRYYTLVYANPCAMHIDPIEKKPFYHFLPASLAFSISTAGCNFNCKYCQNWQISQYRPEQTDNIYAPPEMIAEAAKKRSCQSIAYTYAEPTVFYEYMLDTAKAGRKAGVKNVVVSAGYIHIDPLKELCENVDAVKIDLKAFRDKFYREICTGTLKPVLDTLVTLKQMKVWHEIVVLVVPTLNDTEEEFRGLATWIMDNLGSDVPLHFSRFHPTYQLKNLPYTPLKTLETARQISMGAGLNYVYIGNVNPDHEGNNTYCPKCHKMLIERYGYIIRRNDVVDGKCKYCGNEIPGVWE